MQFVNYGAIFKFNPVSRVVTTLVSFKDNDANGQNPLAGLVMDSQGDLFGTTGLGGASNSGTVFELVFVPEPSTICMAVIGLGIAAVVLASKWSSIATSVARRPS